MLMANIDKGVQKMTSLEEKKGTMNSEYFGFMSRARFNVPPSPHSMQEQLITVYVKRGGGGKRGYNLKFLK